MKWQELSDGSVVARLDDVTCTVWHEKDDTFTYKVSDVDILSPFGQVGPCKSIEDGKKICESLLDEYGISI